MDACLQYSPLRGGPPHPFGPAPQPTLCACSTPSSWPCPSLPQPLPGAAREGLSSSPGPTPAHPLHTWLPCGLAGGLAPQRCSEPSADWPGPVGRGMIRIAKGG